MSNKACVCIPFIGEVLNHYNNYPLDICEIRGAFKLSVDCCWQIHNCRDQQTAGSAPAIRDCRDGTGTVGQSDPRQTPYPCEYPGLHGEDHRQWQSHVPNPIRRGHEQRRSPDT